MSLSEKLRQVDSEKNEEKLKAAVALRNLQKEQHERKRKVAMELIPRVDSIVHFQKNHVLPILEELKTYLKLDDAVINKSETYPIGDLDLKKPLRKLDFDDHQDTLIFKKLEEESMGFGDSRTIHYISWDAINIGVFTNNSSCLLVPEYWVRAEDGSKFKSTKVALPDINQRTWKERTEDEIVKIISSGLYHYNEVRR
jgi:hypothetical protein